MIADDQLAHFQADSLKAIIESKGSIRLNSQGWRELRRLGLSRSDVKAAVGLLEDEIQLGLCEHSHCVVLMRAGPMSPVISRLIPKPSERAEKCLN